MRWKKFKTRKMSSRAELRGVSWKAWYSISSYRYDPSSNKCTNLILLLILPAFEDQFVSLLDQKNLEFRMFKTYFIQYNSCLNPSVAWWHVRAVTPCALPKKQSLIWKEKLLYNIDITNLTVYDLHPRQLIHIANRAVHFTAIISRSRTAVAYLIQIPSLVGATKVFVCMSCGELFLKVTRLHSDI